MKPFAHTYLRRHKTFVHQRVPRQRISFPPGTFAPGVAPKAYQFPTNIGKPKKNTAYGVVSLGGSFSASDVAAYCKVKGWPKPNLTVYSVGGAQIVSDPGGANVENMSDVEMLCQAWYTAHPMVPCRIIAGIGPNVGTGIAQVCSFLLSKGCTDITCSWGAPWISWARSDISATESALADVRSSGASFEAASGDNSLDDGTNTPNTDYPSCSSYAWSVGGTNMAVTAAGVWLSEKIWGDGLAGDEGGGGGYNSAIPIPTWQIGVVAGQSRGTPDSSANADPDSGYQVFCDNTWEIIGGTSLSSPLTCGLFGAIRSAGGNMANFWSTLYAARLTAWRDIRTGSNGAPAVAGWDPASGNGTPRGPGIVAALAPASAPSQLKRRTIVMGNGSATTTLHVPKGTTIKITG